MCFSETQSYLNFIILNVASVFVLPHYRLSIPLLFLSLKDLIQALSYMKIRQNDSTHLLTVFAWIHISFQPLFVNIFASHFDKTFKYWNIVFFICIIFALYNLTILKKFDIQNDGKCEKYGKYDDFCSEKTESYLGKYHIGYKFKTDDTFYPFYYPLFPILIIIPSLLTKARLIGALWFLFIFTIYMIFTNIGEGEIGAIWCFASILIALPIAIFNKSISKILH